MCMFTETFFYFFTHFKKKKTIQRISVMSYRRRKNIPFGMTWLIR